MISFCFGCASVCVFSDLQRVSDDDHDDDPSSQIASCMPFQHRQQEQTVQGHNASQQKTNDGKVSSDLCIHIEDQIARLGSYSNY
jgi:hypothetical protein